MASYTPGFCSPETLTKGQKGSDGALVDIYALGATLWSALTGKQPFLDPGGEGTEPMLLLNRITTEQLETVPDAPEWINAVISVGTAKRPENRYLSIKDFVEDLENLGTTAQRRCSSQTKLSEADSPQTVVRENRRAVPKPSTEPDQKRQRLLLAYSLAAVAVLIVALGAAYLTFTEEPLQAIPVADTSRSPTISDTTMKQPTDDSQPATSERLDDAQVLESVTALLPDSLSATVTNGVVKLTGSVTSQTQLNSLAVVILGMDGVSAIEGDRVSVLPATTELPATSTSSTEAIGKPQIQLETTKGSENVVVLLSGFEPNELVIVFCDSIDTSDPVAESLQMPQQDYNVFTDEQGSAVETEACQWHLGDSKLIAEATYLFDEETVTVSKTLTDPEH